VRPPAHPCSYSAIMALLCALLSLGQYLCPAVKPEAAAGYQYQAGGVLRQYQQKLAEQVGLGALGRQLQGQQLLLGPGVMSHVQSLLPEAPGLPSRATACQVARRLTLLLLHLRHPRAVRKRDDGRGGGDRRLQRRRVPGQR
jgi:hypothetical protein